MWMIGHLFSLRGVTAERPVVVYEGTSGLRAARVFWLLEYLGHPNVRVLDGGIAAWRRQGLPLSTDPVAPVPSTWHGTPNPERIATWQDVLARLGPRRRRPSWTRAARTSTGRGWSARVAVARFPAPCTSSGRENLTPDGRYKPADDLARDVRAARRDARPRGGDVLPGRVSRRAHLPGAPACSASATCATTPVRGRSGAIARTCRSSARSPREHAQNCRLCPQRR